MTVDPIAPAAGLTRGDRRHVVDVGPSDVLVRTSYQSLLGSDGFVSVVAEDVTARYTSTLAAWLDETERRADTVIAVVGSDEFAKRQRRRTGALDAVDATSDEIPFHLSRRNLIAHAGHLGVMRLRVTWGAEISSSTRPG